jgi:cytochrome c553
MKAIVTLSLLMAGVLSVSNCQAASPYAGKEKAAAVCSQCHGIKAPSADAPFPSLAGWDAAYIKTALKQFRDKSRTSEIMNAIAGSLTDDDINDIVSYYSNVKP